VFGLALTVRLCATGDVPPDVAENESVPGLTVSVLVAAETVKVTGTLRVMPLPTTVIVPVNVPAASPVTLAVTVSVAGVVPLLDETRNQVAPLTVAVNVALGVALTVRFCEAGELPPAVAENDSEVGLTVSVLVTAETVRVTGTL
jgi:hypothetical protein